MELDSVIIGLLIGLLLPYAWPTLMKILHRDKQNGEV